VYGRSNAESINAHINLPSVATISVVSASIGKGVFVRSGPDQRARANLLMVASAASATGKSAATRPTMDPLKSFEGEKLAYFNEITGPELISEQRLDKKRLAALEQRLCTKRGKEEVQVLDEKTLVKLHKQHTALVARLMEIDEKLVPPTITAEDITQEAAAILLSRNNEQLCMFSADAAKVVSNLEGLYNRLSVPDDNFYVKGHSGDPFVVHRVSRDEREIRIEPDAREYFFAFHDELVPRRKSDLADINSFIARWHEHAFRMGIVLHVGLHGARAVSEPLCLDTAKKAVEIIRWFGRHQLRILSHSRRLQLQKHADHLRDLLLTRYPNGVSLRDLDVHHNRRADLINRIVAEFSNIFCLENRTPGPGRPSPRLRLKEGVRK
jgi:hypothetical protein